MSWVMFSCRHTKFDAVTCTLNYHAGSTKNLHLNYSRD